MSSNYLYELKGVNVIDRQVELTVRNLYTLKEKVIKLPIENFDLNKVCNKLCISQHEYGLSNYWYLDKDIDFSLPLDYTIINEFKNTKRAKAVIIPTYQLYLKDLNEFVYQLLSFKHYMVNNIQRNYRIFKGDKDYTKRYYLHKAFNEYTLIRKKYFNKEFYKYPIFKNLNKIILKLLKYNLYK